MRKLRVVTAHFSHETNVFCPFKTGWKEYEERDLRGPDELFPAFEGTRTTIGGFLEALTGEEVELIPIISASATPAGKVTGEIYEYVTGKIIGGIKDAGKVDGVLLALHGAMVSEVAEDGEGTLLKAIREVVGAEIPIVCTLDLHANVTDEMVEYADAFFPYENYPHTDAFERGYEAAKLIIRTIRREVSPVMRLKRPPVISHMIDTGREPHLTLLKEVHKWEENPKVINVAIAHGFAWSDIPETGVSVVAVTDGDAGLAEEIVNDMAKSVWRKRNQLLKTFSSVEDGVKAAIASPTGPVVIGDIADNPGCGSTGDTTFILRELMRQGAKNVGLAIIVDPETVQKAIDAGVRSRVKVALGGKMGAEERVGKPVETEATVKTIADGLYVFKGPMGRGVQNDIGHTVVLEIEGIEIVVASQRIQPFDAEIFRRMGIEPTEKKILVVKSANHYRASFGPLAKEIIDIDTPAYASMNLELFDFKRVRRPIFPLDKNVEYA